MKSQREIRPMKKQLIVAACLAGLLVPVALCEAQPQVRKLPNVQAMMYNAQRPTNEPIACQGDGAGLLYAFANDGTWEASVPASDDESSAELALPFSFRLFGQMYTSCWINNNGNVTFDGPFDVYTPAEFPVDGPVMVAPFWADIDTRSTSSPDAGVWHKLLDSDDDGSLDTLVVTWNDVGYFLQHGELLSSFQVAISNGTNPLMGTGQTVCFTYDSMCFACGDVSGVGGFGGAAATVGLNGGDGVEFDLVGRFDQTGGATPDPTSSLSGGVAWLDNQRFLFETGGNNVPPVPINFPVNDLVELQAGDLLDLTVYFDSPEPDQVTTVVVADPNGAQTAGLQITNTPGETAQIDLDWLTDCNDAGTYALTFTATDNDPLAPGTTVKTLTINVAPCQPPPPQDGGVAETSKKGSLLVFTKIELRWRIVGNDQQLVQDTFVDLTNDYPSSVAVQMYFINGDPALEAVYNPSNGDLIERAHPGCNGVDNMITLTGNEPSYWSALTGYPKGVSPFTVVDPAAGAFDAGNPATWPGRPANDGSGDRVLRGWVLAWAVDAFGDEIRWNHLKGDVLIINYDQNAAWEYNTWAFATTAVAHGYTLPDPGVLRLDGLEYDNCPALLMLDFYASQENLAPGGIGVANLFGIDTDLTLLPMWIDLRQDGDGPTTTKAKFDIWNQNEIKFSGTERCITCWDQELLSNYDVPNHFLRAHLQTNKGKARVDGMASIVCDEYDELDYPAVLSIDSPLLAVAAKRLVFNQAGTNIAWAGVPLVGMGEEAGEITYDLLAPPPEAMGLEKKK